MHNKGYKPIFKSGTSTMLDLDRVRASAERGKVRLCMWQGSREEIVRDFDTTELAEEHANRSRIFPHSIYNDQGDWIKDVNPDNSLNRMRKERKQIK